MHTNIHRQPARMKKDPRNFKGKGVPRAKRVAKTNRKNMGHKR